MDTQGVAEATFYVKVDKISHLSIFESSPVLIRGQPWVVIFSKYGFNPTVEHPNEENDVENGHTTESQAERSNEIENEVGQNTGT